MDYIDNKEGFDTYRRVKLDNTKTTPMSIYYIFTHHKEYNTDCKNDIWLPLVEAFEKIYLNQIIRLKVWKKTKKELTEIFEKMHKFVEEEAYMSLNGFENSWKEDKPSVMSIVSDSNPDSWKWSIELRLNNSIDDSFSTKMKQEEQISGCD